MSTTASSSKKELAFFIVLIIVIALFHSVRTFGQNVGIGINTPAVKLHVRNGLSGYIGAYFPGILLEDANNTYLNILTGDFAESGILFGNPLDLASGGIVYNNVLTQTGLQFRTRGNITRMVIDFNGNVGIGTHYPTAPLDFGNMYGKKITLRQGSFGEADLSVWNNELRIASEHNGADISVGFNDYNFGFTERFRMKGNGAFVVNGTSGQNGQILSSGGNSQSPTWKNTPQYFFFDRPSLSAPVALTDIYQPVAIINNQSFTLNFNANLMITVSLYIQVSSVETNVQEPVFYFTLNNFPGFSTYGYSYIKPTANSFVAHQMTVTKYIPNLSPGTYSLDFTTRKLNAAGSCNYSGAQVIIQAVPL